VTRVLLWLLGLLTVEVGAATSDWSQIAIGAAVMVSVALWQPGRVVMRTGLSKYTGRDRR
jgi:uncharacterized membrane protein